MTDRTDYMAEQGVQRDEAWLTGALAGLNERLDRLFLSATDHERFILSKDSANNIVEITREWLRNRLPAAIPHTDQRLKALARRNEFWAVMMKPLAQGD